MPLPTKALKGMAQICLEGDGHFHYVHADVCGIDPLLW